MKTFIKVLPIAVLLSSCGAMQGTSMVHDDVYDVPDRAAMAATASAEQERRAAQQQQDQASQQDQAGQQDEYYNDGDARSANTGAVRDYYDMTYNDPYYYNTGRFGFGTSMSSFGPYGGMGMSYGWPTSFGGMSVGFGTGMYGGFGGYDPYWSNSWMSGYGYGYNPYSFGNPYGYYGYGNYGYGYGGYGMGYGPYQSPWGGCYGCYEPTGYSSSVYGHRASLSSPSGSGTGSTIAPAPRAYRNPASLIAPVKPSRTVVNGGTVRDSGRQQNVQMRPEHNDRTNGQRPARNWSFGGNDGSPSRGSESSPSRSGGGSFGGGGGGGRTTSPRPR